MIYCVIAIMTGFVGLVFGAMIGDKTGYDRGVKDTHDYYHSKGARR